MFALSSQYNITIHEKDFFVQKHSIVRRIWGNSDTILFIFAGAAGEFALSKAVDWLFYTGKLPADPIGRLFSTVTYARAIVFSEKEKASKAIQTIRLIHTQVEQSRTYAIPDWAYKQVLFMLIHYSVSAFEVLERKMTDAEKQEVMNVFLEVGTQMGLENLPHTMAEWEVMHKDILQNHLAYSSFTKALFDQYQKHLGNTRHFLLKEVQRLVSPARVSELLGYKRPTLLHLALYAYKFLRWLGLASVVKKLVLPVKYQKQIEDLDIRDYENAIF